MAWAAWVHGFVGGVGQTFVWVAWVGKILAWVKKKAWVAWVHKILAWDKKKTGVTWVKILTWVTWVHKISEGRNFGVVNVVVQMVWVHKVFFKFLSVFSITRTKTYLPINI